MSVVVVLVVVLHRCNIRLVDAKQVEKREGGRENTFLMDEIYSIRRTDGRTDGFPPSSSSGGSTGRSSRSRLIPAERGLVDGRVL
jgi:hypothetical protein